MQLNHHLFNSRAKRRCVCVKIWTGVRQTQLIRQCWRIEHSRDQVELQNKRNFCESNPDILGVLVQILGSISVI
jgi:hypothetical protein